MSDDFRHLQTPRRRPELFGVATLDTVTCALAAGIVLMILMAALTERGAKVTLTNHRQILQSGVDEAPTPSDRGTGTENAAARDLENLAVVFFSAPQDPSRRAQVSVRGRGCNAITLEPRTTRSAASHFRSDGLGTETALTLWAAGDATNCTSIRVTTPIAPNGPCTVTLVTGGHFDTRTLSQCAVLEFNTNQDKVLRFKRSF